MDGSGAQNRWSISDEIAAKINYSTTMQALCIAWLYPAVSLVWSGFASIGLRTAHEADVAAALDRAQAIAVLLAIFSFLIGGIWAVRTWEYLPVSTFTRTSRNWTGPAAHVLAVPVAFASVLGAVAFETLATPLALAAGLAGCFAGMLLPRWLLRAPLGRAFPIAAFGAVVVFQVTVGWVHVLTPSAPTSAFLVIEGLGLSWAAVAAARAVSSVTGLAASIATVSAPAPAALPAAVPSSLNDSVAAASAVSLGSSDSADGILVGLEASADQQDLDSRVDLVNPVPTLQSLREPAVGH